MSFSVRTRAPHRLFGFLLVAVLCPAVALVWLSWAILQQDKALERQRVQDGLERVADSVAAGISRSFAELEERLPALWAEPPAADAVVVSFDADAFDARPARRLAFWPTSPPISERPRELWDAGEALEFRERNYAGAILNFRDLAASPQPAVRAGALIRLGRNLQKALRVDEALTVYGELEQLGVFPTEQGTPADLLARETRWALLATLHRPGDAEREARALLADLQSGRWRLDRVAFEYHLQKALGRLKGASLSADLDTAVARAEAVEWLWHRWTAMRRDELRSRGRQSLWFHGRPVLAVWRKTGNTLLAVVAGPEYLQTEWGTVWRDRGVAVAVTDLEGRPVMGGAAPAAAQAVRTAVDTNLPWTLRVAAAADETGAEAARSRRGLLLTGLGVLAFLVCAASYAAFHAAARELAVARLQTDFVSAVSHEFRTPLTAMRHLTELLKDGLVPEESRRAEYYSTLANETERLHRLVESLLDFRRMEAGAHEYRFETLDPLVIVTRVVGEFANDSRDARVIDVAASDHVPAVRADAEAIGRALRNLLDNAVKYSPPGSPVRVEVTNGGRSVAIRVSDRGPGIPVAERREIFKKFVRGSASKASNVKGTGIGLAMVEQIVSAHGGTMALQSELGSGTTFTMRLPVTQETT